MMWDREEIYEAAEMPYGYNKPAGMMLIYPVVSSDSQYGHLPSFYNLLGTNNPEEDKLRECSLENNVSANSVPLFFLLRI